MSNVGNMSKDFHEAVDAFNKFVIPQNNRVVRFDNSEIGKEAAEVQVETGLTPRQLAGQRAELLRAATSICEMQQRNYGDGISTHIELKAMADELRAIIANAEVERLKEALNEIAHSKFCDYDSTSPDSYGTGVTDGHRYCAKIARAALAEKEEVL